MSLWEQFTSRAQSAAGRLRVRSALNPMLWHSAIIGLPCLSLSWLAHGVEPIATILAPIAIVCAQAIFFSIFRPEKLQSEDYQLRHETLELIKQKGSSIEISPSSLEVISNPVRELPVRPAGIPPA